MLLLLPRINSTAPFAASKFRTRVGESLASVERHGTPLAEATTSSLEALKAYSTGYRVAFTVGFSASVPHLERAIAIDPQFAMAYAVLGNLYSSVGESVRSLQSTSKAYELRDRANDRDKFYIIANYQRQVTGNLERAQETCEIWAQTYPRDAHAHGLLSGFILQSSGKYEKSIEAAKKAIALDPDLAPAYANLAATYFNLNRLPEAENTIEQAYHRKLDMTEFLVLRYYISLLKGDVAGVEQQAALSRTKLEGEHWIIHSEALASARAGRLRLAEALSRRAIELARQAGQVERAATYLAGLAVSQAFFGLIPEWAPLLSDPNPCLPSARKILSMPLRNDMTYTRVMMGNFTFTIAVSGSITWTKNFYGNARPFTWNGDGFELLTNRPITEI